MMYFKALYKLFLESDDKLASLSPLNLLSK
jgi:hypothetical protein